METKSKNIFWKMIVGGATVLILGIVVYFLLFSPKYASIQKIITVRNNYETQVFKLRKWLGLSNNQVDCGVLGIPVRPLKTMNEHGYKYLHSVKGVLVGIDPVNQTMRLRCGKDTEYSVHVMMQSSFASGWVEIKGSKYQEGARATDITMLFYPADIARSRERDEGYKDGDIYTVVYPDTRDLTEILGSVASNPEASLNIDGKAVLGVLR